MNATLHLVKLCVGIGAVAELAAYQQRRAEIQTAAGQEILQRHVTRMWPRRDSELLAGGSLYWVIKGHILARQTIQRLDEVIGEDGIRRCGIVLDPQIVLTSALPRRPFQGWRYLADPDAPADCGIYDADQPEMPHALQAGLAALGVI